MEEISEVTVKDVWPHLCALGLIEVRINNRTVWSDSALDVFVGKDYYNTITNDYFDCVKEELFSEWYDNFRITDINIKIIDFHHCVADITGYYEKENE